MRVLFVARWRYNPYQSLLAGALRGLGVEVVERELEPSLRAVEEERPDVLHLQSVHDRLRTPGAVLRFLRAIGEARKRGVRIVWTVHDLRDHKRRHAFLGSRVTRFLLDAADAIVVHCQGVLPPSEKVFVIPHGHYIGAYENRAGRDDARRAHGIDGDAFVFLFFGWIRKYKGVLELVDAFRRIEGARLLIAGAAPERWFLRLLRLRAGDRVTIADGPVPEERVQLYMNACDAVVLPYRRSLTSGAAVLAMSFAKPCIAPRIGCFEQTLGEDGAFLYGKGGLLEAMRAAMRERDRLPEMGRRNFERASRWDWGEIAARTLEVYA